MEEPWSPSTRFHSLGSRALLPASLDILLSNSLKQNVHTDTASWRRENTKDVHITHVCHTHPCPPLARWSRAEWAASFSCWELMAEPWACQKIREAKGMEHAPLPLSPRQSLGKAMAKANIRARRPLIAPRIKASTFQPSLLHIKRDGNWLMPREAIKQYGKTINTSCQFTYSFFNLFLYFISLQILSVCLTYILYIFIYQYNTSL